MGGRPKIYVDFSVRDPEGRFYTARLADFEAPPALDSIFAGTDRDEFDVECRVLAVDHQVGRVYHRPTNASEVPGTSPDEEPAHGLDRQPGIDASHAGEPVLIPA